MAYNGETPQVLEHIAGFLNNQPVGVSVSDVNCITKVCCTCGQHKLLADYAIDKSKKDGHHSKCKACVRQYKQDNARAISEQRRKYRAENREAIAAYKKTYDPGYQERNREANSKRSLDWAKKYPERRKQIARESRRRNAETSRAITRNRRALAKKSGGRHDARDVMQLLALQQSSCACCGKSLLAGYHVDHIVPLARGGGNDRMNLQLLCPPCNLTKNARDPLEFMQSRGFLL